MTLTAQHDEAARRLERIAHAAGENVVTPGHAVGERYLVDWSGDYRGRAFALARPRTTEEVASVVAACAAEGVPITVQGGHTGLVGAASPLGDGDEVIVSLERMGRVRAIDVVGGSVTVEAGAILAEMKAVVEEAGAFFPLSLGAEGSCHIGGNIGTNAGGVNVVRYGMMRDLVLGLEVVLPDGSILSDLRGLRKNNTGYDWKQLFIGAEGTLGIVTAACLKTFPKPTQVETLWLAAASPAAVMAIYKHLRKRAGDLLSAFELLEGDAVALSTHLTDVEDPLGEAEYGAYALVELSAVGGPRLRPWLMDELAAMIDSGLVPDGVVAESLAQATAIWRIREAVVEAQSMTGKHLRTDVSVPIEAIPGFLEEAHELIAERAPGGRSVSYGHVGDGNIHLNVVRRSEADEAAFLACLPALEQEINALVDRHGGSISAEHGIGISKRGAFAARMDGPVLSVARLLKNGLDPAGLFGRDRIFSTQARTSDET
ncbi:MAG: FAD-binding oxidoreductase [Pseudomonadota bacterium]